jgi:hypothetical protein
MLEEMVKNREEQIERVIDTVRMLREELATKEMQYSHVLEIMLPFKEFLKELN